MIQDHSPQEYIQKNMELSWCEFQQAVLAIDAYPKDVENLWLKDQEEYVVNRSFETGKWPDRSIVKEISYDVKSAIEARVEEELKIYDVLVRETERLYREAQREQGLYQSLEQALSTYNRTGILSPKYSIEELVTQYTSSINSYNMCVEASNSMLDRCNLVLANIHAAQDFLYHNRPIQGYVVWIADAPRKIENVYSQLKQLKNRTKEEQIFFEYIAQLKADFATGFPYHRAETESFLKVLYEINAVVIRSGTAKMLKEYKLPKLEA